MTQHEPKEIGAYEVVGRAGRGGMGDVFLARDPKLGRLVAIKRLPSAKIEDQRAIKRFLREAQVLATLDHANIARIFSLDEDESGQLHIVLEYVEGETLREVLRRGPLPLEQAMRVTASLADALAAAHRHGVVHRDIKPGNVMIDRYGHTRLLDFGLAKLFTSGQSDANEPSEMPTPIRDGELDDTLTFVTELGTLVGTVGYMSPEQVCGEEIDERSDIFSLGCVIFEMLAGERPFVGPDKKRVMSATLTREPAWDGIPESVPGPFRALIKQSLVKDSTTRLADVRSLRDAAESVIRGEWSVDRDSGGAADAGENASVKPIPLLRGSPIKRAPVPEPDSEFYSVADDEPSPSETAFLCHTCGRRHRWVRERVNEVFFCTCGTKLTVPDLELDGLEKEDRRWYTAVAEAMHQPEFDSSGEAEAESFGPRRVRRRWLASPGAPLPDESDLPSLTGSLSMASTQRASVGGSFLMVWVAVAAVGVAFFTVMMAIVVGGRPWQITAGVVGPVSLIWLIIAIRKWCGPRTLVRAFLDEVG